MIDSRSRRPVVRGAALMGGVLLQLAVVAAPAQGLTGTVSRVIEGDRLVLQGRSGYQHTVRMAGIDAPEPGQPYAEQSEGELAGRLTGRFVVVDFYGRDARGQVLGRVSYGGEDMNLEQVAGGMARFDSDTANLLSAGDRRRYVEAEAAARRAGRGVWGRDQAVAPRQSGESAVPGPSPGSGGR